jgi:hypothetical protein
MISIDCQPSTARQVADVFLTIDEQVARQRQHQVLQLLLLLCLQPHLQQQQTACPRVAADQPARTRTWISSDVSAKPANHPQASQPR